MSVVDDLKVARRLGVLDPLHALAQTTALSRWGPSPAALYTAAALRHPRRLAAVDHAGSVTYGDLDRRTLHVAQALRARGLHAGDHIGLLCCNHIDFLVASIAAAKAGLACVYLNTGFAAPQLGEVLARENVRALIVDHDLLGVAEASGFDGEVIVADTAASFDDFTTLRELSRERSSRPLLPSRPVAPILLTSGTTGTPKGARRDGRPSGLSSALGLLERIPYQSGDVAVIPTPLFHAWGLAQSTITALTASTAILVRTFSPKATIAAVRKHRATVLAVVPVMLQRILTADEVDGLDLAGATTSLRIVASSGSALPAQVGDDWMDQSGDNLYNMYGSTEVGQATLATPADLRAAPGTAGRVVRGSSVRIVDASGDDVADGDVGRIIVGNSAQFTGYTGGGTKDVIDGLMSSGDVGRFDPDGRLFVTGRADDMIVSGGENVFPHEVEELLLSHPDIIDAAVYGVDDADFGQRLAAQIVKRSGGSVTKKAITTLVSSQLARHKVPRDVRFVAALPRNTTGKLLRSQLTDG